MYPRHYFDLFRPNVDQGMVFVGMSFAPEHRVLWTDILEPAILDSGHQAMRVDQSIVGDAILIEIMKAILNARLLVFEISADGDGRRNGNVMYELGLAHAMRHPEEVVILRSDVYPLLFDIRGIRVHSYDSSDVAAARDQIAEVLVRLTRGVAATKEVLLEQVVGQLDEVCLGFMQGHATMTHFSLQDGSQAFTPETVAGRNAIRQLMELGLLRLLWKTDTAQYAYSWTYMGLAVLSHIGFLPAGSASEQLYNYTGATAEKDQGSE